MNFEAFRQHCLSKKAVEETYPFGPQAAWFKIGGKAFCWTFVDSFKMDEIERPPFYFVNMKCDPEQAETWRAQFPAVQAGWHQNKKHWNSVYTDGSLQNADFKAMVDHAYEVVFKSLPKKKQTELQTL